MMLQFKSKSGFTLVEASIATVVVVILMASATFTSQKTNDALDEAAHREELVQSLHRALDRLIEPMAELERAALLPLIAGSDEITYHTPSGYELGVGVEWGSDVLVALELEPGELDDGIDNDGDGLVDEGQVVRTISPGAPDALGVVLCKGVPRLLAGELPNGLDDNGNALNDEAGFSVDVQGEVLTIRLTLMSVGPGGRVLTRTAESAVKIRN